MSPSGGARASAAEATDLLGLDGLEVRRVELFPDVPWLREGVEASVRRFAAWTSGDLEVAVSDADAQAWAPRPARLSAACGGGDGVLATAEYVTGINGTFRFMLAETVREAAIRFGDSAAFIDPDGTRLSFAALDAGSDAVAAGLAARGLGPGDRLVLRVASTSCYVIAYVTAAKLGAVTAGVNPVLAPPEQERLTALADPTVVLTDGGEIEELAAYGTRAGLRFR